MLVRQLLLLKKISLAIAETSPSSVAKNSPIGLTNYVCMYEIGLV
jgi:hypothetical protein